uniref:Uncharacterized protein n=1 Tax=Salmo trutta TaxID=8032 RepID=A0A673XYV5_SALTR
MWILKQHLKTSVRKLKLGHSSSSVCPVEASLNEPVICYILDGVLILYSIITTVLFFIVKVTLIGWISFTLRSNSSQTISIGLRSGDCGGQVI